MRLRNPRRKALVPTVIALIGAVMINAVAWSNPVAAVPVQAETWAFCGPHPDDPMAVNDLVTFATKANIDATMGPCMPPPASYTPAFPGSRYMTPADYATLAYMGAATGVKTIPYDARLWSTDAATRNAAIAFWQPYWSIGAIRAWDMGDEFDPQGPEWAILVQRWAVMITYVLPATGVGPYTNHLPWALDEALRDLPFAGAHLSFDDYNVAQATATAQAFNGQASHLMCSVNALTWGPYNPFLTSPNGAVKLKNDMVWLRYVGGCDSFLVFGGVSPAREGVPGFGLMSVVNPTTGTAAIVSSSVVPKTIADAIRVGASS